MFVVTGTSGAGKGTLERELLKRIPELELAVSATTREKRPGEENGREYWFVDDERFERLVQGEEFVEHIRHSWGPRHGTLWSEIERIQRSGRIPILDLETLGAVAVKERVPNTVTIFVKAPTFEELERRLRERATESGGEIEERLAAARKQLELENAFDHVIVNADLDRAVDELEAVVRGRLAAAATMSRP